MMTSNGTNTNTPDDTSYIVSGFPRSGTSMMMRMLELGGLEIIANDDRWTSTTSPYGILELEDNVGIAELDTAGKVVKLVAPYIELLPVDRKLKVIFMIRDPHEIVASLMAMGVIWEFDPIETIKYARDFLAYHDIPTYLVRYTDVLKYPRSTAMGVVDFLGLDRLNINEMIKAVDPDARHAIKTKQAEEFHKHIVLMAARAPDIKEVVNTGLGNQMGE